MQNEKDEKATGYVLLRYGTAKAVAEEIARQTDADIQEIVPAVPYDGDRNHYNALAKLAKKEHDEDQRPAIRNPIPVEDYRYKSRYLFACRETHGQSARTFS